MYFRKFIEYIKNLLLNILTVFGIYDSFDYKKAKKYYSVEIGYIVDDYTDLGYFDRQIDIHMKNYNAIWTASDCGLFRGNSKIKNPRVMVRCNNYSVYDMNLNLEEFKLKLPYIFFIDCIQIVYQNNDQIRFKRIKN